MNQLYRKMRFLLREINTLRSKRGPYRFLVRKWDSISDIDLALRVLETEFFVKELKPIPLPFDKVKSILVIAPHQDDETIGAGGTLLLAAQKGVKIDVIFATDGTSKEDKNTSLPDNIVEIRQREGRKVCAEFGATVHQLSIYNAEPNPSLQDLDQFSDIIHSVKPQVVMMPWVLDSPPKHRLINHLLWLMNERKPLPDFEVWGYQVHNTLFPNGYVDITSVAEEKRKLLEYYASQNEFSKRYDHLAMGMAAWNTRFFNFTEPKYVELFFTLPLKELLHLIEKFYFTDLPETYRGHELVISGASKIHQAVMNKAAENGSHSVIKENDGNKQFAAKNS